MWEISWSIDASDRIISVNQLSDTVNNFSDSYKYKHILIDELTWIGTDVILLYNSWSTEWVIFWIIDKSSLQIFTGSTYNKYNKKHIAYKIIGQDKITSLLDTPQSVYSEKFLKGKLFLDLYVTDFQTSLYNTGSIIDLNIGVFTEYNSDREGILWNELPKNIISNIHLNF